MTDVRSDHATHGTSRTDLASTASTAPTSSPAMPGLEDLPLTTGKVLMVCSSGGHLAQLMSLQPWWSQIARSWVTFDLPDTRTRLEGENVIHAYSPTTRNAKNLIRNFFLARRVLELEKPDVIISTGAAVAVPFFVLGRLRGIPRIYIEVFDRIDSPTVTGRICSRLSTVFCVQTPQQRRMYPRARVIGPLL